MASSFEAQFARPAWWDFFQPVIDALADDMLRIDPVLFMDRVEQIFAIHADYAQPRHFQTSPSTRHPDWKIDFYVLPACWHDDGHLSYRIVSHTTSGRMGLLDVKRLPEHDARSHLVPNMSVSADRYFRNLLLETRFDRLRRKLSRTSEWHGNLTFIDRSDTGFMEQNANAARTISARILKSAQDLIGNSDIAVKKSAYLGRLLDDCLQQHFESLRAQTQNMLVRLRAQMDDTVLDILRVNPSALTANNYHWLTYAKHPDALAHRRALAETYPILMFLDQKTLDPSGTSVPPAHALDAYAARLLNLHTQSHVIKYRQLREHNTGLAAARRLPRLAPELEKLGSRFPFPTSARSWSRLQKLVDVASRLSDLLDRPYERVLEELAADQDQPHGIISRYFNDRAQGPLDIGHDVKIWKHRIATSILAPKLVADGRVKNCEIPVQTAFLAVGGTDMANRDAVARMDRKLKSRIVNFNGARNIVSVFMDGVPLESILAAAFDFATHKGEWDARVREIFITNRLFEHAADHAWPHLPTIEMSDDFYTVVPHRNLAELLKDCLEIRSDLWMEGKNAVVKGVHFLSLRRRGAAVSALAMVCEPEDTDAPWTVERIERGQTDLRNAHFEGIVKKYLEHPVFTNAVNTDAFDATRRKLRASLLTQAKDSELMGFREGDRQERAAMIQALTPYIRTGEDWSIDEHGCISGLKINAVTQAALRAIAPYCRP